jgi:signal transduction histidine kinase
MIGLGFLIVGAEDLVHGVISLGRLGGPLSGFERFIPGTYVAGRAALIIMLILGALMQKKKPQFLSVKQQVVLLYGGIALTVAILATFIAVKLPLPRFIYLGRIISRPVDLIAGLFYLLVLPLYINLYSENREPFHWAMVASIIFGMVTQIYMIHSQRLYDAQFDLSHLMKIFSYISPIIGVGFGTISLYRKQERLTEELRDVRDKLGEEKLNLEERIRERTKDLEEKGIALERQARSLEESRRAIKNVAYDLEKSKHDLEEKKGTLEKINKELDDFTYMVSHDLKEPLRSIDAFSKFIEDDYKERLDQEGKNYLERIRANASRMQALIEDLLEISRIERSKNPFEETQVEDIINESKLRLEYAIKQKNVEIVVRDKLPKVFCDPVRLAEVFVNLISNAIKFTDKQKPVIEIGYRENKVFYEFYVRDNGPGIDEQYFAKIFEIFQRLGRREEYEGTGAGLTIVKKIVEMHNGKIWVESEIGEGTTFHFTIPKGKEAILGKKKIGEILIEKKLVTEEDIKNALEEQERRHQSG